jgi:hypothetical protein
MLNQFALLFAAHPQPSAVFTSKLPDAPPAGADADVELSENVQPWP